MRTHCAVLLMFLLSCGQPSDHSELAMETDDRETSLTAKLQNVTSEFEQYVNDTIDSCRGKNILASETLSHCVYFKLGMQIKESGYSIFKFAPLCKVELWFMDQFSNDSSRFVDIAWKDSRYHQNKTGLSQIGRTPVLSHLSPGGTEHTIVGTVRMNNVLLGIDKWAHFFTTGYHLWSQVEFRTNAHLRRMISRWLEGDDLSKDEIATYRPYVAKMPDYKVFGQNIYGVLGRWSTGIISHADMNANEFGYRFYEALAANPESYIFKVSDWPVKEMNEEHVPSKFVPGFKDDINYDPR